MNTHITKICRVTELPKVPSPNVIYHLKVGDDKFKMYITDSSGTLHQLTTEDDLFKIDKSLDVKTFNPRLLDGCLVV